MGNKQPAPQHIPKADLAKMESSLQRLYKDDKEALRKIFVEFASSSKKPQKYHVDKSVFNQTFRLNGVVGDRMFAMWDLNHNNKLNYQEFIHGLSDFLSASVEDKITMLFSIMDPEHQKVITHQEFTQLMTCLSKSAEASVTFLLTGQGEGNDSAEVDEKTLEGAIKELDAQSTGSISLASFIKWVVKQGALKCFVEKEWMVRQAMAPADAAKLVTEHFYDLIDKMIIPKLPMDSDIVRAALQKLRDDSIEQFKQISYLDDHVYPDIQARFTTVVDEVVSMNDKHLDDARSRHGGASEPASPQVTPERLESFRSQMLLSKRETEREISLHVRDSASPLSGRQAPSITRAYSQSPPILPQTTDQSSHHQ